MEKKYFKLLSTAIILEEPYEEGKDIRYLITQRSEDEDTFPGMWHVPGGHFTSEDYEKSPKDVGEYWYNVLENSLRREVKEETNLDIKNMWYVTSLTWGTDKEHPSIVLSFVAEQAGGEIKLNEESQDYAWVTFEESKKYKMFDGILEELWMVERALKGEKDVKFESVAVDTPR